MRRLGRAAHLLAFLLMTTACLFATATPALPDVTPDAALAQLLDEARRQAAEPGGCDRPGLDRLVKIVCAKRIRIGVRESYPLFATRNGERRQGYEIDVASAIAARLGVDAVFATVKAATRIPMLADDAVDLVIATMGHNTQRDGQVRFIRPHYYQSETLLVGPRDLAISGWQDIRNLTVCVTIGNGSNAELVSRGVRLMLFDEAGALPERLADQTCTLAAQDDSFFAYYLNEPDFSARFAAKMGFAQLPWGMAVARNGSDGLARALDLMSQVFHRDGVFLSAARVNRIGTGFLVQQQAVWTRSECKSATGSSDCVLPAFNTALRPTPFAGMVDAFETWFGALAGIELSLPMLKTASAWSLFLSGIANSLVLIVGALAATFIFAVLFGAAMGARSCLLRWPARTATIALQSSPILLTLVIAATIIHTLLSYSATGALGAAIVALGLTNGSNAGQAISEAYLTLRTEWSGSAAGWTDLFPRALARSATQIVAFLINAAKGTPIASFIGAPELLSTLTDITSFSSERATPYTLLLVFYTVVVMAVVWLCRRAQAMLERKHAAG